MAHLEDHDLLSPHQYGFRAGFSCTSQLIRLFHSRASALDKNKSSDIVFLDFEKAFDSIATDSELWGSNPLNLSNKVGLLLLKYE